MRSPFAAWLGISLSWALPGSSALAAGSIAAEGQAIIGVHAAIDGEAGTAHAHAGLPWHVNDGDFATRVDTHLSADPRPISYVGVIWPGLRAERIEALVLTLATFSDGGWFGTGGVSPAPGGPLLASDLIEPTIQVSSDGGATWTTVPHTSDYLAVMEGHTIGGGANPNPSAVATLFVLDQPALGIDGIRLIGENGGLAGGDTNGFLGVFELEVESSGPDSVFASGFEAKASPPPGSDGNLLTAAESEGP